MHKKTSVPVKKSKMKRKKKIAFVWFLCKRDFLAAVVLASETKCAGTGVSFEEIQGDNDNVSDDDDDRKSAVQGFQGTPTMRLASLPATPSSLLTLPATLPPTLGKVCKRSGVSGAWPRARGETQH